MEELKKNIKVLVFMFDTIGHRVINREESYNQRA